jgi:GT2 family glycosyltransferase
MTVLTIGMPVYNDIDFIEESLISLLNQSYTDFLLIISDDGSTDGSQKICEKYSKIDNRVTYIRQKKNLGISKNMEFLLKQAKTSYFMWAADDDLWDKNFISKHIKVLEENPEVVSVFCTFALIDQNSRPISEPFDFDYSSENVMERLRRLITLPNDTFGYGVFRREKIVGVRFPVWWWPNRKTAYNNIFPTLCYYLSKGDFYNISGEPLFFNRMKNIDKINHKLPFKEDTFLNLLSFIIRRFNLVIFSAKQIKNAGGIYLSLKIFPTLLMFWFLKTSSIHAKHYLKIKLKIN